MVITMGTSEELKECFSQLCLKNCWTIYPPVPASQRLRALLGKLTPLNCRAMLIHSAVHSLTAWEEALDQKAEQLITCPA